MALLEKEHTWADEDCLILTQQQIEQNKKVSCKNKGSEFSHITGTKTPNVFAELDYTYNSTWMLYFRHLQHGSILI